jgi:hypothetical protein
MRERRLTWLVLMWLWARCCKLVQPAARALMIERKRES